MTQVANPRPSKEHALGVESVKDSLIGHINAGDAASVFAMFGSGMKQAVPMERLEPMLRSIVEQRGPINSATAISIGERSGKYRLHAERGEWLIEISLGADGEILGATITDPPPPEPPVARSMISLRLPFRGRWLVSWGGDTLDLNHHVEHPSQRRAADLIVVDERGKRVRGDGKRNQDFFAYGQEILAVADGKVVAAIDGVLDNEPGSMNPYFAPGNAVIVEHDTKIFSVYAHLKPQSLRVKLGSKVRAGQVLGLCGNSGNSSEPHLHFQLQDGPLFEKSWGIEAMFPSVQVSREGKPPTVDPAYTFHKGDIVTASTP
jgi:murein DD-endopeptidase MepM/ murein hydrolase activator NlpD